MKRNIFSLVTIFLILLFGSYVLFPEIKKVLIWNTELGKEIDKRLKIKVKNQDGDLKNLKEYKQVFNLLYSSKHLKKVAYTHCNYFSQLRSKRQYYLDLYEYIKANEDLITIEVKTDKEKILRALENSVGMGSLKIYCPLELESFKNLKESDVETEVKHKIKIEVNKNKENLTEYEQVFDLLYQFKNFETIGQQYCNYFEQLQVATQYKDNVNTQIEKQKKFLNLGEKKDTEKMLRKLENLIAFASVNVRCPELENKLKQLKILP